MVCTLCKGSGNEPLRPTAPVVCRLQHGGPCEYCLQLEDVDCQLLAAEALLDRLTTRRREILGQVNQRHDPFILRLPTELASRVFQLCMPSDEENGEDECMLGKYEKRRLPRRHCRKVGLPHLLGMVCHKWRQIASGTPRLWTSIPIFITDNMEGQLELLQRWVQWSGSLPLTIGIWDRRAISGITIKSQPALDLVNSLSTRWKCLRLRIPAAIFPHITGNGSGNFSQLQEFRIKCDHSKSYDTGNLHFSGNKQPSPRKVVLYDVEYKFLNKGIDWSHVVHADATKLQIEDIVIMLQGAPRLERLAVKDARRGVRKRQEPLKCVVHNCLKVLTVDLSLSLPSQKLWDAFTFPSLVELSYHHESSLVESFFSMLSRSQCRVTTCSVTLGGLDPQDDELIRIFHCFPFLINLKIQEKNCLHPYHKRMLTSYSDLALLPELQQLTLILMSYSSQEEIGGCWRAVDGFVRALVGGHDGPNRALKTFRVFTMHDFGSIPPAPLDVLESLPTDIVRAAQRGIDVSVVDNRGVNFLEYHYPR